MLTTDPERLQSSRVVSNIFPRATKVAYRVTTADEFERTLDQFFDEEQFEAYRQLGVHVADGLFSRALMSGNINPASMPIWFRQLASSLLEPRT